ncbi:MAG: hypothetical protein H7255_01400 [Ramlibacter sp.]|nr:hypothetical protein [Ramlibacter sp.]
MDHEDIVVVIALTIAGQVLAFRLKNDDIAAVDQTRGIRGSFNENIVQRTEYFVDDGLLAREFTASGAAANGAPNHVIATGLPKGLAIAFGDLIEYRGYELCVRGEAAHGASFLVK